MAKPKIRACQHIGERNGRAVLTPALVRQIRAAKGTQAEIAARFKVHQATVSRVLLRKTWAHVPDLPPPAHVIERRGVSLPRLQCLEAA